MMRRTLLLFIPLLLTGCGAPSDESPFPTGMFVDDYGMRYEITDTTWAQDPGALYRVMHTPPDERVLFLRQSGTDSTSARWTRVEWMEFEDMAPWTWGYCYAAWDEPDMEAARAAPPADRSSPRTGCGGFPFSRMQPVP